MAFAEDLDVFLADFGVSVIAGAVVGLGIFDMPGQDVLGTDVISTMYTLTARTNEYGHLSYGDTITVADEVYTVQEAPKPIIDGAFCRIPLEKVAEDADTIAIIDGDFLEPDAPAEDTEVILDGDFL